MDSYEAEELGKYTSLSSMAVCALVLGLASPIALLAPLMVVIPLAGVVVALFALMQIANSAGALSGRPLATAGLVLSVICGIASPLRVVVRDSMYSDQAEEAGRVWLLAAANNQLSTALEQLTGNAKGGLMGPPSGEGPPPKYDPETTLINLGKDTLVTKLRAEAEHGDLTFAARSITCDATGITPRVAITYQTTAPDDSLTINVILLRSVAAGNWLVDSWRLLGETEHDHSHAH